MKPPFYDEDLIQLLQLSGENIGGMDDQPDKRAEWILFLVDEIKGFITADQYAAMVEQLNSAITSLREGNSY